MSTTQKVRNGLIRITGWGYQIAGIFRGAWAAFLRLLGFLGRLLGFSTTGYVLESDEARHLKSAEPDDRLDAESVQPASTATRRRPNADMDYFLNMARQTKPD